MCGEMVDPMILREVNDRIREQLRFQEPLLQKMQARIDDNSEALFGRTDQHRLGLVVIVDRMDTRLMFVAAGVVVNLILMAVLIAILVWGRPM